jgi:hypothetical protein
MFLFATWSCPQPALNHFSNYIFIPPKHLLNLNSQDVVVPNVAVALKAVIKLGVVVHTYNLGYSGGGDRKITDRGWLQQKLETLCKKQPKAKKPGDMAQVAENLTNIHESLSPIPSTTKKFKNPLNTSLVSTAPIPSLFF